MPGTPIAKSASLCSANSFTCFGVMTCSASDFRSSGRMAGNCVGVRSPLQRSVGGRPTLRCRSEAFCLIISCRIALKLNGVAAAGGAPWAGAVAVGLAIGIDPEKHLAVLHRVGILGGHFLDYACELGLDLIHDLHRFDDAENLPLRDP